MSSSAASTGFHAIIPAGGAGTRLWPLSRRGHPKFLHDLTGSGRTLLQATWDRLLPITGPGGVVVVTGHAHADAVREQLPGLEEDGLFVEPSPRDSMAAIGLAAAVLRGRHGDDVVVGSFAADHVIGGSADFAAAVKEAVVAARAGFVTTIGIAPREPSTGFGYIEVGEPLGLADAPAAHRAVAFTEKPDAPTAAAYLATGRFRWNAGMYVVAARVLLEHLHAWDPGLHDGLARIAAAWDTPDRAAVLAREWPELTRVAIDRAIAEPVAPAGGVAVVPGDFDWDDVGDWASLAELVAQQTGSVRVLGTATDVMALDGADGVVVPASGRLVVLLGVPDVVVVDTPDALLVTNRANAQQVKDVVGALAEAGRPDLL